MEGNARERLGKENNQCVATHRSLEGLGYLGMLSATPTDMGSSLLQQAGERERKTVTRRHPVCKGGSEGVSAEQKKRTMPSWA